MMNSPNNNPEKFTKQNNDNPKEHETAGEAMHDSMSESAPQNDNSKIKSAESLTNEHGELNAEAFKKSYQQKGDDLKK